MTMNKLGYALLAILALAVFAVPPVFAATYCVINDRSGNIDVTAGIPVNEWSLVSPGACFSEIDAARRASGVGTGGPISSTDVSPDVMPR
ncbi:MAG: hypothetical protein ACLQPD_28305 [Desulfomonilaceae bacterium]